MPIVPLAIFFVLAIFFIALIQVEFLEIAFAKLGLSPEASILLLVGTLVGSGINLPIYALEAKETWRQINSSAQKPVWELYTPAKAGQVVIAVNLGGCVIPVALSLYFISEQALDILSLFTALLVITALSYRFSRLIPGVGVAMPILIAPIASAFLALTLDPAHAAQLAYISGVLGVLIGADILHLKDIGRFGSPVASIGGAGTFDGIFLTGIIAALLA